MSICLQRAANTRRDSTSLLVALRRTAMPKSIRYGRSPGPTMMLSLRFKSPCATPAACIASTVVKQLREERLAIGEPRLVLAQRRPRDVLEREVLAVDEPERARNARDAAEPRVDGLLAAQQRAPQAAERPAAMRLS